jgi:hypothetical protein
MTAILPAIAIAVIVAYALLVRVALPELRSEEATLGLTLLAFAAGVVAFTALTLLPIAARHERTAAILAERWHLAIIGYAQGAMVLIGFLLLAVLGIA